MISVGVFIKALALVCIVFVFVFIVYMRYKRIKHEIQIAGEAKIQEMRHEFSSNVTHELKTPLQTITGYAELIAMNALEPEEMRAAALKIREEAFCMNDMIDDIVCISDLNECTKNIVMEEFNLYEIAENVVSSLRHEADKNGVELILEGTPLVIYGSKRLVEMLIDNLCDNGIKYNKPGGKVRITVGDGGVTVRDDGKGIPKEEQERIFEMFYRIDKSRSRELGGNGLGLCLVKLIARRHDAELIFDSEEGKGTTVRVIFKKQNN